VPCWITHTNERTHEIIPPGWTAALFTGVIKSIDHVTVHRSRTRSCVSRSETSTRSSRARGADHAEIYRTVSRPRCLRRAARAGPLHQGSSTPPSASGVSISTTISIPRAQKPTPSQGVPRLFFAARSTGPPGTRNGSPGAACRNQCRAFVRGRRVGLLAAMKRIWGVLVDDSSKRRRERPYRCSRAARNTGCNCARTTPICAYRGRPEAGLRRRRAAGMRFVASVTRWPASFERLKSTWVDPAPSKPRTRSAWWARRWNAMQRFAEAAASAGCLLHRLMTLLARRRRRGPSGGRTSRNRDQVCRYIDRKRQNRRGPGRNRSACPPIFDYRSVRGCRWRCKHKLTSIGRRRSVRLRVFPGHAGAISLVAGSPQAGDSGRAARLGKTDGMTLGRALAGRHRSARPRLNATARTNCWRTRTARKWNRTHNLTRSGSPSAW